MRTRYPFHQILLSIIAMAAIFSTTASAAAVIAPDKMIRDTQDVLQPQIQSRAAEFQKDPAKLYQFVNESILPHFDFTYIAQLVLGKSWRDANEQQKTRFTEAFKNMLVRTYAHALLEYRDQNIQWEPLKMTPGATDASVDSKVLRKNGPPVPMSYRVHLKDGEWKVYDVVIDAVSLVTNYRGSFASEVRKNGLDSLITRLESKQPNSN